MSLFVGSLICALLRRHNKQRALSELALRLGREMWMLRCSRCGLCFPLEDK